MGVEKPVQDAVVRGMASLCPLPRVAERLQGRVGRMLVAARLFVSPRAYSRLVVSAAVLPAPAEALALLLLPLAQAALIVGGLAALQASPVLALLSRSNARRRATDAELPFFLMTLSVFVRGSEPTLQEGFRRVAAIGPRVFPGFNGEAELLARDDAFVPGSPVGVAERAFSGHPSARLRAFVQGFLKTLATGKDAAEFLAQETSFQVQRLEQSWAGFAASVGSLAEVTFIVLALFPVGLEMVGAAVTGFTSSPLFLASFALVAVAAAVFLLLMDAMQPVVYDTPPSAVWLSLSLSSWALSAAGYAAGALTAGECALVPVCVSALGFYRSRARYSRVRRGEVEVGAMLHELAEESKAGVALPDAVSRLAARAGAFPSIGEPVLAFYQSTRLGLTPTEAQRRVDHPSWLVRLGFGILSIAFETGAGFEHLEELSALFRRVADARKGVAQSMVPFVLVGAIVPVISVAAASFLSGFAQAGAAALPGFAVQESRASLVLSVSTVSALSGVLLSKLLTQTVRHEVALPLLMASTLASLLAFGVA